MTYCCSPADETRQRWREAAARVVAEVRARLSARDPRRLDGDGVVFDVAVVAAAVEDVRDMPATALSHARSVFQAQEWAVDDDCESENPAFLFAKRTPLRDLEAQTSAVVRQLLQQVRRGGGPISICRPGYGWELTLSHRRLTAPEAPISVFEFTLAGYDTGVFPWNNSEQYYKEWNEAMVSKDFFFLKERACSITTHNAF